MGSLDLRAHWRRRWLPLGFAAILPLVIAASAAAQLEVEVREVICSRVVTPTVESSIYDLGGYKLAGPIAVKGESQKQMDRPAAVIQLSYDRPLDEVLVKFRCKTATPWKAAKNFYVIDEPGTHDVEINVIGQNPLTWDDKIVRVQVGRGEPAPNPDADEGEDDSPEPAPDAGPVERVLMIYETADITRLSSQQLAVLRSTDLRKAAEAKGIKLLSLDADAEFFSESSRFRELMERDRPSTPWLVVDGARGIVLDRELPASIDEMLALIDGFKVAAKPVARPVIRRIWTQIGTKPECRNGVCREVPIYGWKTVEVQQ